MNIVLIILGKILSTLSTQLNLGSGSTWPGHIALNTNKNFIKELLKKNPQLKIILIAGTNGKTTTGKLIQTILEKDGKRVFQNEAGANLLNGIASSLLLHSSILCLLPYDYAVFEVDENSLPLVLNEFNPNYLILLNLFRDQLDRYGEVNTIANKWKNVIAKLPQKTTLILNADDPQIAYLGSHYSSSDPELVEGESRSNGSRLTRTLYYFGLNDKSLHQNTLQHAVDSTYCPNCKNKLTYKTIYFSHLGDWKCNKCSFARPGLWGVLPYYPLSGVYNQYNTNAAVLLSTLLKIDKKIVNSALHDFTPAFGRQEVIEVNGKKTQIFLSKNPTSFNESLKTVIEQKARHILLILNDRIPDGKDVSWIWDTDFNEINDSHRLHISGDRVYDMALRVKYAIETQNSKVKGQSYNSKFKTHENLEEAVRQSINEVAENETLYVLPTYSAMLEVRKILTGKKIL